jgi:hypothetical protein
MSTSDWIPNCDLCGSFAAIKLEGENPEYLCDDCNIHMSKNKKIDPDTVAYGNSNLE